MASCVCLCWNLPYGLLFILLVRTCMAEVARAVHPHPHPHPHLLCCKELRTGDPQQSILAEDHGTPSGAMGKGPMF